MAIVPIDVDADAQVVSTEVLIFPGEQLLTPEGRLTRSISLDTYATESGTITFPQGSVPAPIRVRVPGLGLVQRYPFDSYRFSLEMRSVLEPGSGADPAGQQAVPMSVSVHFKVPGWGYRSVLAPSGFTSETLTTQGVIRRTGGTVTIAVIFIALIVMFGVLAVVTVLSGWAGRTQLTISTASWLTSSVFALIALRSALPGHPPLGSWMDVLAYFWVIAAIMVMIGATVGTLALGGQGESPDAARGAVDPFLPPVAGDAALAPPAEGSPT